MIAFSRSGGSCCQQPTLQKTNTAPNQHSARARANALHHVRRSPYKSKAMRSSNAATRDIRSTCSSTQQTISEWVNACVSEATDEAMMCVTSDKHKKTRKRTVSRFKPGKLYADTATARAWSVTSNGSATRNRTLELCGGGI